MHVALHFAQTFPPMKSAWKMLPFWSGVLQSLYTGINAYQTCRATESDPLLGFDPTFTEVNISLSTDCNESGFGLLDWCKIRKVPMK